MASGKPEKVMERANGIGGVFFRAKEPDALKAWYARHLGVDSAPVWMQAAGPTVFAPFAGDTDYFPADKAFMLNLRVENLDAMITQLEATGIAVETRAEWDAHPEVGRFARIHDPEGNPIELWQPGGG